MTVTVIAVLFTRTATMIAILTKMSCFHVFIRLRYDRNSHKVSCFWVFIRIVIIVVVLTKMPYFLVFIRTATMITVLFIRIAPW